MPRRNANAGGPRIPGGKSGHKRVHKGSGRGRRRSIRSDRAVTRFEAQPQYRDAAFAPRPDPQERG
jgi:hypothetical protein